MWLHPSLFSMAALQLGQGFVLLSFHFSALFDYLQSKLLDVDVMRSKFIDPYASDLTFLVAALQDIPSCQGLLQWKHI